MYINTDKSTKIISKFLEYSSIHYMELQAAFKVKLIKLIFLHIL